MGHRLNTFNHEFTGVKTSLMTGLCTFGSMLWVWDKTTIKRQWFAFKMAAKMA